MATPYIQWISQKSTEDSVTYANISGGTTPYTVTTGATDAVPHKLSNDIITISKKAPVGLKDPAGNDIGDKYYATFNSVSRSDTPAVEYSSGSPAGPDGDPPATPETPAAAAYSTYSYTDDGHMSLNGGVFELLPFTAGVSPATSKTYFDFAGTGRSPYPPVDPPSYSTADSSPQVAGMLVCGAYTNIESSHSYTIGTQEVRSVRDAYWSYGGTGEGTPYGHPNYIPPVQGAYGTSGTVSVQGNPGPSPPATSPSNATVSGQFDSYFGDTTATAIDLYGLNGQLWPASGLTSYSQNRISENYTIGGTYHNGTAVNDVHTGAIEFAILPDTEAIINRGNDTKTTTGTASWAAGQARIVTFTCASPHCLTDANNRVYVTGASNNAINGLWNVATVTSDTAFTARIFGATCATITSSVNIVTYDGIDKAGGVLKGSGGAPDLTVIAGGMASNNQVILKGDVNPQAGISYTFWGNTTTDQLVGTVEFTGARAPRSMFTDAKLTLNTVTGAISTGGEYNAATNLDGGMKEIDHWCPRYMHAKIKALERNDPSELFKANTSGQHALDQWLNSPMVDSSNNITTFLPLHETFHETIHFTLRAQKKPSHRRLITSVEDQDWIRRDFYIDVFNNALSDRNEIVLDYIDITNKTIVSNTDTSFVDSSGAFQTNTEHLANGYSNGVFTNL